MSDEIRQAIEVLKREAHLGDGLYASFDGYNIILGADRDGIRHWVALEPEVLEAFDYYRKSLAKKIAAIRAMPEQQS